MQVDQRGHIVGHLLGVLQRPHPLAHQLRADHLVMVEADTAVGLMPSGARLADVMKQRRPAQHQIGPAGFLQGHRLSQHRQRVLVDVLVLVMFVDGHPHGTDLRQHHLAKTGLDHQFDTRDRVGAEEHFVQFDGDPLDGDPGQLRRHRDDGLPNPIGNGELQLGDEPRGTQHPQRIVAE